MTQRVIYFTAGPSATVGELADIANLNAAAESPYSVLVMNSLQSANYGAGKADCDLVAGTIPTAYAAVPTIDPDNIPTTGGVGEGGTVNLTDSYGGTAESVIDTITDGVGAATISDVTKSIFTTGEVSTVSNSAGSKTSTGTCDVATNTFTMPATDAIVSNTQALVVPVTGVYATTATVTVANGIVTGIVLS